MGLNNIPIASSTSTIISTPRILTAYSVDLATAQVVQGQVDVEMMKMKMFTDYGNINWILRIGYCYF